MSIARDQALLHLDARPLPEWPAHAIRIRRPRSQAALDPRDRALAEQLELGVIKNLLQLQFWIEHYARRPLHKIHPTLQKILALALYQLRFLDRIPASAAVNEAVEQTRRFGMKHASSFVNAVLRKAAGDSRQSLPDVAEDPARQAQWIYSHPPELFDRLCNLVDPTQALAICRHNNQEPPTIARLFPGRTLKDLANAGASALPHQQSGMAVIQKADKALLTSLADSAIAQVQDPTSAQVVQAADINPGQTILDRCCGVGTKTIQMCQQLGPTGHIVAIDPSQFRCDTLRQSLARLQIHNVQVVQTDRFPREIAELPRPFHRILVDAPCSNSGVLARRPEARYAQSDKHISDLQQLQQQILQDCVDLLAPDGWLIYSTCSIWPGENQQMVRWLIRKHSHLQLIREEQTLPSTDDDPTAYHDGGYYAILTSAQ